MISLQGSAKLVTTVSELPDLSNAAELFLDVETRFDLPNTNYTSSPWLGDRICGVAITVDNEKSAWYVPYRHTDLQWNLPKENVCKWLKDVVSTCKEWINHNVKFDAHQCTWDGAEFTGRLVDTLTLAKLHQSDRFIYGLKPLCREWLGMNMQEEKDLKAYLKGIKSKNYGDVPADILGDYACMDVISNRALYRFLQENLEEGEKEVWETEILLTPVLYDIEKLGMRVDEQELKIESAKSLYKQLRFGEKIKDLIGLEINCDSSNDMFELIVQQLGLPVLGYTEKGNPSFDKDTLSLYVAHPEVINHSETKTIIETLRDWKTESTFYGLFLKKYLELSVNGVLHPSYNQCVRTGRMSCSSPNAQQLNKRAKKLIKALEGYTIVSNDYSQIEFRLIVHYIKDLTAIESYTNNPKTDFHKWVGDMSKIARSAAKVMNFLMAFGGGKKRATEGLIGNVDIIAEMSAELKKYITGEGLCVIDGVAFNKIDGFKYLCSKRANQVYEKYHETLPGIKRTSYEASSILKRRGFVFNAYGRRRHLPSKFAYKAFNSIIQSCAADIIKERMVAIAPRYNKYIEGIGLMPFALVHDEAASMIPTENVNSENINQIVEIYQDTNFKFRVPMIMDTQIGDNDWGTLKDFG